MSEATADKQFVVVENGQRASGTMSQEKAQEEARRRLTENQGSNAQAPQVEVKQNLFG